MFVTCPQCFSADDVSVQRLPDKLMEYHCAGPHGGDGPHTWVAPQIEAGSTSDTADGVTDELLEPFRNSVLPGEPYAEYGVVEYRFRLNYPNLFTAHVRDRGHVMLAPSRVTATNVRFVTALYRLHRSGELVYAYGRATGAWSYNSQVTYWARPPAPVGGRITWTAFCRQLGRPDTWTDDDRAAAAGSD